MVLLVEEAHVESWFCLFGESSNLALDGTVDAPDGKKPFWMHPMILLGNGAKVEAQFALFGDSANLDVR